MKKVQKLRQHFVLPSFKHKAKYFHLSYIPPLHAHTRTRPQTPLPVPFSLARATTVLDFFTYF